MRLTPALDIRLDDHDIERVRRNHSARISELAALPMAGFVPIQNVTLVVGVATRIAHNLGRRPVMVWVSPPRGPTATGRIEEIRDGSVDLTKYVVLKATDYGADITVDIGVM